MRRRALMAVRPSGGGSDNDFFPLYVTADEVVDTIYGDHIKVAYSYADYSELYNYLREIIITKGVQSEWDEKTYLLYNPEEYGIDIYIDHRADGKFYRTLELYLTTDYDFIDLWHCDDDSWNGNALLYNDRIEWEFENY